MFLDRRDTGCCCNEHGSRAQFVHSFGISKFNGLLPSEPLCVKVPSAEARGLAGREVAVAGTAGRVPWPDGPEGFWVYAVPVTIPTSNSESFDDATFYFVKKPEGNSLTYSAEALTNEFAEFPIVPSGNLYGDAILDSASECAGAFG